MQAGSSAAGGMQKGSAITGTGGRDELPSTSSKQAWYEAVTESKDGLQSSALVQKIIQIREAYFKTLIYLFNNLIIPTQIQIVITLIVFLQTLDFLLRMEIFKYDHKPVRWLTTLCSILTLRYHEVFYWHGVTISAILLVWLTFLTITFLTHEMGKQRLQGYTWTRQVLRFVLPCLGTVLFIPLLTTLLEPYRCRTTSTFTIDVGGVPTLVAWQTSDVSSRNHQCWSVPHIAWIVVNTPTIVLTVILACFTVFVRSHRWATGPSITASAHSRGELIQTVATAALVLIFGPLSYLDSSKPVVYGFILLFVFGSNLITRLYWLPFYQFRWCIVSVSEAACLAWASIVALTIACMESSATTFGISVGLLWTLPIIVALTILFAFTRRWRISSAKPSDIENPYEYELYIRYQMEPLYEALRTPAYLLERDINNVEYQSIVKTCEDTYRMGLAKFAQDAPLHLMYSQFALEFRGNMHTAHRYAVRAREFSSAMDIHYFSELIINEIELRYQQRHENREILAYMSFEHHTLMASHHDAVASQTQLQFWSMLTRPKPDIAKLDEYAVTISTHSRQALTSYHQMIALNPNSAQSRRLYASFLLDVMQDKNGAHAQLELAGEATTVDNYQHNLDIQSKATSQSSLAVFDERNAIVVISGDDSDLGVVQKINVRAAQLFGLSQVDFLGKRVSSLLADPYTAVFAHYLVSYQESGPPLDSLKDLFVICKHASGYIFPAFLHVRKFVEHGSMRLLVLVEHVPSKCALAIVQDNGLLRAASASMAALLGEDSNSLSRGVYMSSFIPNYTTRIWHPLASAGYAAHLIASGVRHPSHRALDQEALAVLALQEQGLTATRSPYSDRRFASPTNSRPGSAAPGTPYNDDTYDGQVLHAKVGGALVLDTASNYSDNSEHHSRYTQLTLRVNQQPLGSSNYVPSMSSSLSDGGSVLSQRRSADKSRLYAESTGNSYDNEFSSGGPMRASNTSSDSDEAQSLLDKSKESAWSEIDNREVTRLVSTYAGNKLSVGSRKAYENPFLKEFSLRESPHNIPRASNPIFGLCPALPVVMIMYHPPNRPEAWEFKVQMIRPPLPASSLSLLVVHFTPRPLSQTRLQYLRTANPAVLTSPQHAPPGRSDRGAAQPGASVGAVTTTSMQGISASRAISPNLASTRSQGGADAKSETACVASKHSSKGDSGSTQNAGKKEQNEIKSILSAKDKKEKDQDQQKDKEDKVILERGQFGEDDDYYDDLEAGGMGGSSISERLRRDVTQENEGISKGLHKFRQIFIGSILLVMVTALATFLTTHYMLDEYRSGLATMAQIMQRQVHLGNIARRVASLNLMRGGVITPSESYPYADVSKDYSGAPVVLDPIPSEGTIEEVHLRDLRISVEALQGASFRLTEIAQRSAGMHSSPVKSAQHTRSGSMLSKKTIAALTLPTVRSFTFQSDSLPPKESNRSLLDLLNLIVYHASLLSTTPLASWPVTSVLFLLKNLPDEQFVSANESLDALLEEDTKYTTFVLQMITLALVIFAIVSLLLIILFILRPTVFEIEQNKSQVILVFLDIPMNIVSQFKEIYAQRVASFGSTKIFEVGLENGEKRSGGGGPDADDMEFFAAGEAKGSAKIAPIDSDNEMKGNEAGVGLREDLESNNENQTFHSEKYMFLAKLMLLFVLTVAYFLITYFAGINESRKLLDNTTLEVRLAAMRMARMIRNEFYLVTLSSYNTAVSPTHGSVWPQPTTALASITRTQYIHDALISGEQVEFGVRGISKYGSSSHLTLTFSNGCIPPSNLYCRVYRGQVMLRGLSDAVATYLHAQNNFYSTVYTQIRDAFEAANPSTPVPTVFNPPVQVPDTFVTNEFASSGTLPELSEWYDMYLKPSLEVSTTYYLETAAREADYLDRLQLIGFIVFSLVCIFVYFVIYSPLILSLDLQIRRTRAMLLMIPEEVLESVPAARLILQNKQTVL